MTDFTKHMTNEQRRIAAEARDDSVERARWCFELALKAQIAGEVSLPATNEDGESVLYGCKTRMYDIRDALVAAGSALLRVVPWDIQRTTEREYYDRGLNIHKY